MTRTKPTPPEDTLRSPERRKLLRLSARAAAGAVALPLISGCMWSSLMQALETNDPEQTNSHDPTVFVFPYGYYQQLVNPGGELRISVSAPSGPKTLSVVRVDAATASAVVPVCTADQCALRSLVAASQQYVCPCDGSVFSALGAVVSGPATQPLTSYSAIITINYVQVVVP